VIINVAPPTLKKISSGGVINRFSPSPEQHEPVLQYM